jgi:putative peptidoglycan lipid II flippase
MFVLREPIVALMQYAASFDAVGVANTADALAGLASGSSAFSIYLFVLRGFYAHQDTRTPFVLNVGENLINIVLAFVLVGGGACSGSASRTRSPTWCRRSGRSR